MSLAIIQRIMEVISRTLIKAVAAGKLFLWTASSMRQREFRPGRNTNDFMEIIGKRSDIRKKQPFAWKTLIESLV